MTQQFYLDKLEKGIKIMRTYNIMINQQQNYKTLPHYMKAFGDFCVDYLKYKAVAVAVEAHHLEDVSALLEMCKANQIEVSAQVVKHHDFIQSCKALGYTDVAECMKVMPTTTAIIAEILKELNIEM